MLVGDALPLKYQAANYDSSQYPRATLTDAEGNALPASPVDLEASNDTGLYEPASTVRMPNTPWVYANILVYSDPDRETLSDSLGADDAVFELTPSPNAGGTPSYIVAIVEPDGCTQPPIQDTIVKGSDRTLTLRLVENPTQNPFDLSGATEIEFRFRNEDGTVLSLKMTDEDEPVVIVNAEAGIVECILTKEQTALLAARTPAPFTLKVTQPVGVTVINVLTQLSIEDEAVEASV